MKISNIIFDFDGTIIDTAPLILSTMYAALDEMGLPRPSERECRSTIGLRLVDTLPRLFPELDGLPVKSEMYVSTYRRLFDEIKGTFSPRVFDGVIATLRQLSDSGFSLAIASSRSHKSLVEFLVDMDVRQCFQSVVGGDDVTSGKPSPEPVLKICGSLQWAPHETLVVGDADVDILMGNRAGTLTCGVTYGYGSEEGMAAAAPDFMISRFAELIDLTAS